MYVRTGEHSGGMAAGRINPIAGTYAEMSALVQQTIPKMQRLTEPQFKGLELEWYKPEEPNKKTGVAEK